MNEDPKESLRHARLQGEFELMLWAVVQTALVSGLVRLVISIAEAVGRDFSAGGMAFAIGASFGLAAIVFLAGFIAVAVAGAPLAGYLDREEIQAHWPFYALGAIAAAAAAALLGVFATFERPERLAYVAPGLLAAHLYARDRRKRRGGQHPPRSVH